MLQEGDCIAIKIKRCEGRVKLFINDGSVKEFNSELIKEIEREYVFFIELLNRDDSI